MSPYLSSLSCLPSCSPRGSRPPSFLQPSDGLKLSPPVKLPVHSHPSKDLEGPVLSFLLTLPHFPPTCGGGSSGGLDVDATLGLLWVPGHNGLLILFSKVLFSNVFLSTEGFVSGDFELMKNFLIFWTLVPGFGFLMFREGLDNLGLSSFFSNLFILEETGVESVFV